MEDQVYQNIIVHVKRLLGIDLNQYKSEQMRRRLDSWLIRVAAPDWDTYFKRISTEQQDLSKFRDYLTINVSEFFRDSDRWDALRSKIFPGLISTLQSNRTIQPTTGGLRIWSAGCSNGSEPYTLMMILDEMAPLFHHYILATDLDRSILSKARSRGPYIADDIKNVKPTLVSRYFEGDKAPFYLKEKYSGRITFKEHNLLKDPFEKNFDLIVCRNVIIYFTNEAKAQLYKNFHDSLRPGGVLFLGGTEIMPKPSDIGFQNTGGSFYVRMD
jgi:chemotaxis protein methyltransferase CheR